MMRSGLGRISMSCDVVLPMVPTIKGASINPKVKIRYAVKLLKLMHKVTQLTVNLRREYCTASTVLLCYFLVHMILAVKIRES